MTRASAMDARMLSTTPYITSPTLRCAGGLNGVTVATRCSGSSRNFPGCAANTRPPSSYVPSPDSYSSATATSSPGNTIRSAAILRPRRAMRARGFNALAAFDAEHRGGDLADRVAVEAERVRDREREPEAVRDRAAQRGGPLLDPRLRLPVVERVHNRPDQERMLQERRVRVRPLGPERRVLDHRVARLREVAHVHGEEGDVHAQGLRVPHRDTERGLVHVQSDDLVRAEQLR